MTPDDLRSLADALEPMARAPRFEDFDVPAFCAWVRACADAQPVAWMHIDGRVISAATMDQAYRDGGAMQSSLRDYTIPLYAHPAPVAPAGWKLVPVEPTPEMLSAVGMMDGYDWHAPGCSPDADHANWYSAMIAAAPAVPQAEPKRDQSMLDLLAVIHCDGGHHTEAVGIEQSIKDALSAVCVLKGKLAQAEPKREPLSEEQMRAVLIAEARWIAAQAGEKDPDSLAVDEEMLAQVMLAGRAVERAHGI